MAKRARVLTRVTLLVFLSAQLVPLGCSSEVSGQAGGESLPPEIAQTSVRVSTPVPVEENLSIVSNLYGGQERL